MLDGPIVYMPLLNDLITYFVVLTDSLGVDKNFLPITLKYDLCCHSKLVTCWISEFCIVGS